MVLIYQEDKLSSLVKIFCFVFISKAVNREVTKVQEAEDMSTFLLTGGPGGGASHSLKPASGHPVEGL